ncbi:sugar phosphate isomerase/epimerase family protein [Nitrospirillum pindoramense]|uniref:Sugar phosphate isomerase/epimerase n=1 Tax=Nitrospirillum amazonense TaxID=28077 RepID=A0A560H2S3_9PROT|nr:sugar phosphate isomerase/epimerase [Nitrospirillum amazonense]TWB40603.1 sugar phosphate isomerase/epimerase [Nitrospirillum amazonense]
MTAKFKYGVSLYSFTDDLNTVMTLEDAMAAIADMGATGVEILGEAHIPGYPDPDPAWVDRWYALLDRHALEPTNYGCWIDTRLRLDRPLDSVTAAGHLVRDIDLAARLGFKFVRPKIGVVSLDLVPDPIWEDTIVRALETAERRDVVICPEIHSPTPIRHPVVDSYVDFIQRTGTKHFGLLLDTGVFQDRPLPPQPGEHPAMRPGYLDGCKVPPEHIEDIIQYVVFIQAKFHNINDQFVDEQIPWDKVVPALKKAGYAGYLSSEYEGERLPWRSLEQVRRQHALIRKLERDHDRSIRPA